MGSRRVKLSGSADFDKHTKISETTSTFVTFSVNLSLVNINIDVFGLLDREKKSAPSVFLL